MGFRNISLWLVLIKKDTTLAESLIVQNEEKSDTEKKIKENKVKDKKEEKEEKKALTVEEKEEKKAHIVEEKEEKKADTVEERGDKKADTVEETNERGRKKESSDGEGLLFVNFIKILKLFIQFI